MRIHHPIWSFLFGLLLFCLVAASAVRAAAAAETLVSANIKFLSLGRDLRDVEIYVTPEKRLPVHAAASYISANQVYQGPQRVVFVKAKKAPAQAAVPPAMAGVVPEPEVLATVELDPTGGDYLLLFSGDADTRLEVMAVPFSSGEVPFGSCLVWNITRRSLGVVLGGDRGLLAPRQRQVFRPATMTKEYFDFRIFDEYQGAPRALAGGPHFLKDQSRQLIFLVERVPGGIPVQIRVIEEMPEFSAVAAAASRN
jgi:hypothetical protein